MKVLTQSLFQGCRSTTIPSTWQTLTAKKLLIIVLLDAASALFDEPTFTFDLAQSNTRFSKKFVLPRSEMMPIKLN